MVGIIMVETLLHFVPIHTDMYTEVIFCKHLQATKDMEIELPQPVAPMAQHEKEKLFFHELEVSLVSRNYIGL